MSELQDNTAAVTWDVPFARIPHWVIYHPEMTAQAIRAFSVLSARADNTSLESWPSVPRIAEEMGGVSRSTAKRALQVLVDIGAVTITRRMTETGDPDSNIYRLHTHPARGTTTSDMTPLPGLEVPVGSPVTTELEPVGTRPNELELEDPNQTKRNLIWDALAVVFGEPTTETNRTLRGKVTRSLTKAGATYEEILKRAGQWPLHYEVPLTETSLEKHWDRLGRPPLRMDADEARRRARKLRAAEMEAEHESR